VRAAHQDVADGAADEVALKARRLEFGGQISNGPGNAHDANQYSRSGGGVSRKSDSARSPGGRAQCQRGFSVGGFPLHKKNRLDMRAEAVPFETAVPT
jgi:hypothetical protein